jgi:hypothetical protein
MQRTTVNRTLAAIVIVIALAAASAQASGSYSFVAKPTGIPCKAADLSERSAAVRCDLRFLRRGHKAVFLHRRGRAQIARVARNLDLHNPHRLRQGVSRKLGPFVCTSKRQAVSCRTNNGHGFTVGPRFQLVF